MYKLVREVLCALVANSVGLVSPRPGITILDRAGMGEGVAFATESVQRPFVRPLNPMNGDAELRRQLSRWRSFPLAIAFDEWIANTDRTTSNLLYVGTNEFVLIDHGDAIPGGAKADQRFNNLLARQAAAYLSRNEIDSTIRRVKKAAAAFSSVDFRRVKLAALVPGWAGTSGETVFDECCRFLADRLYHLDTLIEQAFGSQQQSMSLHFPSRGGTQR